MASILPSKKILMVLLVLFLTIGAWAWFSFFKPAPLENNPLDLVVTEPADVAAPLRIDSDGDGLQDWEEALWGTDPLNPDSDGDGLTDTAEVENEQGNIALETDEAYEFLIEKNLNTTEQFARDLYASVATASSTNEPENQAFLELLTEEQILGLIPAGTYTEANFESTTSDVANITSYFHAMEDVLGTTIITSDDVLNINNLIVADSLESQETQTILAQYETQLDQTIYGLTAVSVPDNIISTHAAIADTTDRLRFILAALQESTQDPLISFAALATYQETIEVLLTLYADLGYYFQQYSFLY